MLRSPCLEKANQHQTDILDNMIDSLLKIQMYMYIVTKLPFLTEHIYSLQGHLLKYISQEENQQ